LYREAPVALGPEVAAAQREALPRGTRAWFALLLLWLSGWAGLALWSFEGAGEAGLALGIIALMCFYLTLCNSFLPLPTAWIVLLAAGDSYAVVDGAVPRILIVAGLATSATIVANLNEYHLLSYMLGISEWASACARRGSTAGQRAGSTGRPSRS
jgi:hypothetical protein